jgi:cephalosporin hydroxylase
MPDKKLYTREEFEALRLESAKKMAEDPDLKREALDVLIRSDKYFWIHQSTWFGEPVLNLPQDLFAMQEIIFKTRPKFIIEVGVAWGGGLLFYSTILEVLGGGSVIGIDTYLPEDMKQRINAHPISKRISLLKGSSVDVSMVDQVKAIVGDSREIMVILDSHHTHDHVLKELELYSPFVGMGHYIVCGDTLLEYIPEQTHRPRPWGPGNNPKTALDIFLQKDDSFQIDKALENKLLFSCNPGGYLRRCR